MKIYADLSFTKISGQYIMQKALRDELIKRNMYETKENCDVAVYVQVPFEGSYEEFSKLKREGKKIVFIHHYFSKFEHYAIFTVPGLLELVDLNICIAKDSQLYDYLVKRGCNPIVYEQVAVDQDYIYKHYWKDFDEKEKSICFVGRANKGLDDFLSYINKTSIVNDHKIGIFCATDKQVIEDDALALKAKYGFDVYVNKCADELWKLMTNYQFIYMNADMLAGKNHLETVMHEAMSMGVIVILGDNQRRYIVDADATTGFVYTDFYKEDHNSQYYQYKQIRQRDYLKSNFIDKEQMMDKNINTIINYFK